MTTEQANKAFSEGTIDATERDNVVAFDGAALQEKYAAAVFTVADLILDDATIRHLVAIHKLWAKTAAIDEDFAAFCARKGKLVRQLYLDGTSIPKSFTMSPDDVAKIFGERVSARFCEIIDMLFGFMPSRDGMTKAYRKFRDRFGTAEKRVERMIQFVRGE